MSERREQPCYLGSIPLALRSRFSGPFSGPEQAIPHPIGYGRAGRLGGALDLRPVVVTHAEVAFGCLPCGRSAGLALWFDRCFHVHSIWAPKNFAILYLMGGHKQAIALELECLQKLGLMAPTTNPAN